MLNPTAGHSGPALFGKAAPATGLPRALAGLPAGALIGGTVVGREGPGQLLLRTAAGMVLISTMLKLERGTVVKLRVRQGASPHLAIESVAPKTSPDAAPQPGLGSSLAADLDEAMGILTKAGPGLAPGLALAGGKLAGAVLYFLAALKHGDFTAWFGSAAIKALEARGRGDLVARLVQNFGHQARLAEPTAAGEWQALFVPLQDGGTVRQLRFFFRRRDDGERRDDGTQDSRFLVEIETSRLGGMQLDGLVGAGRFDLVLRSRRALPEMARRDIREIFTDGLAITGQTGKIAFQTVESLPVLPIEPMPGRANQGLLV